MKEYTYYFADGTKNTIQIEDKWYEMLKEMDKAERLQNRKYNRHNIPLSKFDYVGDIFVEPNSNPFEKLLFAEQREKLDIALSTLTDCQRRLFERYVFEGKKVTEIAEEDGVSHQAITDRIDRIKKKLQKFLN